MNKTQEPEYLVPKNGHSERESKHLMLWHSLVALDIVYDHAKRLEFKIRGSDTPDEPDAIKDQKLKSLIDVLNDSPGRIEKTCALIHEVLEAIEQELF